MVVVYVGKIYLDMEQFLEWSEILSLSKFLLFFFIDSYPFFCDFLLQKYYQIELRWFGT